MTKESGALYLVVIPTITTLLINAVSTAYSGIILYFFTSSDHLISSVVIPRLLTFLFRMLTFQSLQWVFGIAYHFTKNEYVGTTFSILGSFEGLLIFCSLIRSVLKKTEVRNNSLTRT